MRNVHTRDCFKLKKKRRRKKKKKKKKKKARLGAESFERSTF